MKIIVCVLMAILTALSTPAEQLNGDVNCDENVDILDIVHLINYKYKEGESPCPIRYPVLPVVANYKNSLIPAVQGQTNQWVNIAQISIETATSGTIILEAQSIEYNWSGATFNLGFGTSPSDGMITYQSYSSNPFQIASNYGEILHEVITVEAGTHTFYYNMYNNDNPRSHDFKMVNLIATFFSDNAMTK